MTDWQDACDPVPARKVVLSPGEASRRRKLWARKKEAGLLTRYVAPDSVSGVDPDFDKDGL